MSRISIAAHRGLLSLDDEVRKCIPELPDYGHPITLRQKESEQESTD
jgi:CubicO group peptidase (beta-lactamase class C family)